MELRDLKPEQHAALEAQISGLLEYYQRLLSRLDDRRFPTDGETFRRALAAMKAAHALWEHVHFNHPGAKCGEDGVQLPF